MLHTETVEAGTLDLIRRLVSDDELKDFFLVGGTALSLLIGHRISIDIDLFTQKGFDSQRLKEYLEQAYSFTDGQAIRNGVFGFIDGVKIDLIAHQYPLINPLQEIDGIRMLSLPDIGAMKLHAIHQNGSRYKDFIDIYFLLEERSLHSLLNAYEKKYSHADEQMALKSLTYFDDIDYTVPIKFIGESLEKQTIEERLRDAVQDKFALYEPYKKQNIRRGRRPGI